MYSLCASLYLYQLQDRQEHFLSNPIDSLSLFRSVFFFFSPCSSNKPQRMDLIFISIQIAIPFLPSSLYFQSGSMDKPKGPGHPGWRGQARMPLKSGCSVTPWTGPAGKQVTSVQLKHDEPQKGDYLNYHLMASQCISQELPETGEQCQHMATCQPSRNQYF